MRVHDSQAYRKIVVTTEHIRHILELREILLSFHTGFNLANAAVVCVIQAFLWLETLISYNLAQVLEACDCLKLLSINFNFCVDATDVIGHQLGLLGTDLLAVGFGGFVETLN